MYMYACPMGNDTISMTTSYLLVKKNHIDL